MEQNKKADLKVKFSNFRINDIIDSFVDLCNVYEIRTICTNGTFSYIGHSSDVKTIEETYRYIIYNYLTNSRRFVTFYTNADNEIHFYENYIHPVDGFKVPIFSTCHALGEYKNQADNFYVPNYIKEFINYVIDYRIKNNLEEIKEEKIKELEKEYLKSHLQDIKKLYDEVQREEEIALENHNETRKKILEKIKK